MEYKIDISSLAQSEADKAFLFMLKVSSPENARYWYEGLLKAIFSLSTMPKRCVLARENDYFSQEIRQLIYGKGKNCYRILFTILEDDKSPTVRILHIRHVSQITLGEIN
ncbi:type II toxin-antitoxin system RelE/ParE family toxin [Geminocystis sp. CENA526]|uniref:type II toxin-antitoxin system RelE/ParE family toxin n=1 Tax=Geminocystis sp. CENA526 TaxID=1355871 RepID=UPI003D6FDC6F